jgi:16S rRNA G966 N2-methylase RsmD
MSLAQRLEQLWQNSTFRAGIHLTEAERAELKAIGIAGAAGQSRPLLAARLGPAEPPHEGRQTPWHGYPTFPAQHATATCCRACLAKHHEIAAGAPLSDAQLDYLVGCLEHYWQRELETEQPCQCRRCSSHRPSAAPTARRRRAPHAGAPADAGSLSLSFEGNPEGSRGAEGQGSGGAQEQGSGEVEEGEGGAAGEQDDTGVGPPLAGVPVTTGYNDIDLRRWKEYRQIETGSLWLFGARARGGGHQLDYHGNFIPQIATQTFLRYSRRGEIVLDLFLGTGTSAIEAARLGRRCIGVELQGGLVEKVRAKLPQELAAGQVAVLQGDSASPETAAQVRDQLRRWGAEQAQLLVLHPPYHDIIRFSEQPEDLSNAGSVEAFLANFAGVAQRGAELLQPGRFAILVIGDKYTRGELVPLGFRCMQVMNDAGFRTRSIIVKNIEGNEIGKGRTNNLWRYRALRGGFYLFKHEYVMVFQR